MCKDSFTLGGFVGGIPQPQIIPIADPMSSSRNPSVMAKRLELEILEKIEQAKSYGLNITAITVNVADQTNVMVLVDNPPASPDVVVQQADMKPTTLRFYNR